MFSGFRNIFIIGLAVLVGLCLAGQPVRAGETIGSFDQVTGEVTVRDRGAKRFPASIGMPLENGYMVKTGQDSAAAITLIDGALFKIAPGSNLVMDEFILDADTSRSMKTRLLRGAMQYVGGTARFKTDDRLIFLENVSASIRGTNFLAIIGSRIQFVLISGAVELGARSNSITLDRRGHMVVLDRTGRFNKAELNPDEDIMAIGAGAGLAIDLPPVPKSYDDRRGNRPVGCAISGKLLICG